MKLVSVSADGTGEQLSYQFFPIHVDLAAWQSFLTKDLEGGAARATANASETNERLHAAMRLLGREMASVLLNGDWRKATKRDWNRDTHTLSRYGITVTIDAPCASAALGFCDSAAVERPYRVARADCPHRTQNLFQGVVRGGVCYSTPACALLQVEYQLAYYQQLTATRDTPQTDREREMMHKLEERISQLRLAVNPANAWQLHDFVAFHGEYLIIPHDLWAPQEAAEWLVDDSTTRGRAEDNELFRSTLLAARTSMTWGNQARGLYEEWLGTTYPSDDLMSIDPTTGVWTAITPSVAAVHTLEGAEARTLIHNPLALMGVAHEIVKRASSALPLSIADYANLVGFYSEACANILGRDPTDAGVSMTPVGMFDSFIDYYHHMHTSGVSWPATAALSIRVYNAIKDASIRLELDSEATGADQWALSDLAQSASPVPSYAAQLGFETEISLSSGDLQMVCSRAGVVRGIIHYDDPHHPASVDSHGAIHQVEWSSEELSRQVENGAFIWLILEQRITFVAAMADPSRRHQIHVGTDDHLEHPTDPSTFTVVSNTAMHASKLHPSLARASDVLVTPLVNSVLTYAPQYAWVRR